MSIEITPATLDQVIKGRGGRLVQIEADVGNVAKDLQELDSTLRLKYNEAGEFYAVYNIYADGSSHLVTTATECDQRLYRRVKQLYSNNYDYHAESERLESDGAKERDHEFKEKVGEASERLAHAIRTDLRRSRPGSTYIPPDISPGANRVFLSGGLRTAHKGTAASSGGDQEQPECSDARQEGDSGQHS